MKFFIYKIILIMTILSVSNNLLANSYFSEGKKLFDNNNLKKSKFNFERDIVFNPKSEKSYLYLAKIFKKEKNDILEKNNLQTVLLLNPKNEEAIYLLALLNIKESNFSQAKDLIENIKSICVKLCSKESELKEKLNNSKTK